MSDHLACLAEERWSRAAPYLSEALKYCGATHTIDDVKEQWMAGRVHLWLGERCAAATETVNFPQVRVFRVWLAGGDITEMQQMRAGLEAFARASLCSRIEFMGRMTRRSRQLNGWRKSSGYEPAWVQLCKDL